MTQNHIAAVAMAAMLVLAGCSGAPGGSNGAAEAGTVSFYVSDQPNAIDDFEHLNVTITEVAFASGPAENRTGENGTEANGTTEDAESWETYDVNATVDLTQYRGANATLLGNLSVPAGDYSTVKMDVSTVEGTLANGSETEVKLPSGGLKLPKGMTVSADESLSFVFDVSVVKAGNSGKYVLKPVVGESGTDVPIEVRERRGGPNDRGNAGGPDRGDDSDDATTTESGETELRTGGQMNFYVSDERNAIDDFEHLNVTISSVGLHAGGEEVDDEENETETESPENSTTTTVEDGTTENDSTTTATDSTSEDEESDNDESDGESVGWTNYEVDNATVDLTQYQGANATRIADFGVPNATYDKVFVHVAEIDGTLTDGTEVNVKLPSEKLQIKNEFTVGNNESIDFVFDITVFKAGNSGKYILKPVVGESGTDVPIEKPDETGPDRDEERNGEDRRDDSERGPQDERTDDERTATTTERETTTTVTTETTATTTENRTTTETRTTTSGTPTATTTEA